MDQERLRKDLISHHVLRLAYCRTEELRRWLLAQECLLFKARFSEQSVEEQVCSVLVFLSDQQYLYHYLIDEWLILMHIDATVEQAL